MYTTCMFCERDLGANLVLETFPVGRRVAFDAERGRLWVVCRRCERWNLAPMEERWEAVEDCERLFRETRLRVSTEHVGLARHAEGLELVRIGRPLRPEFAAWRYGDQFGRRRRKAILYGAAGAAVFGTIVIGGAVTGVISSALLAQSGNFVNLWTNGRTRVKVRDTEGRLLRLKNPDLQKARIRVGEDGLRLSIKKGGRVSVFEGDRAQVVAGRILPKVNSSGGNERLVRRAVDRIQEAGHPERFLLDLAEGMTRGTLGGSKGQLGKLDRPSRLALEMAVHEERERRALEGELRGLEIIWRQEEEIAAIADDLLLPEGTRARLRAFGSDPGA